ncbi:MAG: haloacid dehalogenase-like hydrolase [Clostridiales bacterium]|nr:haloacid dehalogenase-like hydrolase [Clostridiales bacterium]
MNVYDFDETIFTGDSEVRFFDFMFKKKGFRHFRLNFKFYDFLHNVNIISKTKSREHQYAFLKKVKDIDTTLEEYWDEVEKYMKPWYFEVKRDDDIIASGTPRFLLEPIMKRLGLKNLVATEMDKHTGKIDGYFAIGQYKIDNFKAQFGLDCIDKFYSDAYTDHFLADLAKEAYVLHGENDEISDWNEYFDQHPDLKATKLNM